MSYFRPQLAIYGVVLFLFVIFARWGIVNGLRVSRAQGTMENAEVINQAIAKFYSDQGVYPTVDQFENQRVLLTYMSEMPQPLDGVGFCQNYQTFRYNQVSPQSYTLKFCLYKDTGIFLQGVHTFTEKGLE